MASTAMLVVFLVVTCSVGLMAEHDFSFDDFFHKNEFMPPHFAKHDPFEARHPPPMGMGFPGHRPLNHMTADEMKHYEPGPDEKFEFKTYSEHYSYHDDNGVKSGEAEAASMVSNNDGVAEAVGVVHLTP